MSEGSPSRWSGLIKTIGPGILYAGAAVGVSHLVQATRAGAMYGFALVWAVLAANLFKYPFFEFGYRYGAATGESLLHGYLRVGRRVLILYLVLSFCLSIPATAVVTLVTAGLAVQLFDLTWLDPAWMIVLCSVVLLAFCVGVLLAGKYPWLDKVMKVTMVFLTVSTILALIVAARRGSMAQVGFERPEMWGKAGIAFLIALMGWMPTPVDATAWPSLWAMERNRQTGHKPSMRQALFDFNLGYIGAAVLAFFFLSLGTLVMYGTGEKFAETPHGFAAQFVNLYTTSLGSWARPIILVAAFATMLGTVLTVVDCYPRVLRVSCELAFPRLKQSGPQLYWGFMGVISAFTILILVYSKSLLFLVDLVTIVAFLSAPVLAFINYRVMAGDFIPQEAAPPRWLRALAWLGLLFLTGFSILYLIVRFELFA